MNKEESFNPKPELHERNINRVSYDFELLTNALPELETFVKLNETGAKTVDFSDAVAVKILNKALLKAHYRINFWDIPDGYLCPPIPGRADYIHYIADLIRDHNYGKIPKGDKIIGLDVGVGANCIYPIIGNSVYGWSFVGSDIDERAIENAQLIVDSNPNMKDRIKLQLQPNAKDYFYGAIRKEDMIDFTICNPPFYSSQMDADKENVRKTTNISNKKINIPQRNFGGHNAELYCEGGEKQFVTDMIKESRKFASNCYWFTTLVSKQNHIKAIRKALEAAGVEQIAVIPTGQGNKTGRIVAWTFLNKKAATIWRNARWNTK